MSNRQWSRVRLGDVIQVEHGWSFKSEFFSEDREGNPIVVNIGNFRYTGGFRFGETRVREYLGDYPNEYELEPDDILLIMTCQTSKGEILGVPAKVPDDHNVYLHNQRLGKVVIEDKKRVWPNYLYWVFLWPRFNHALYLTASGTKILHTSPSRIENFEFHLPPLREQQAIAEILDSLNLATYHFDP
jgi:type I restriction enzyme S subunit